MTTRTAQSDTYTSGFCSVGRHDNCRGDFQTATCTCPCHQVAEEPEPEVLGEVAAALTDVAIAATFIPHCPSCTCGDPH